MPTRLLDLRSDSIRRVAPPLPLTNGTASGSHDGYTVQAQRRSTSTDREGNRLQQREGLMVCISIDTPSGGHLDVVAGCSSSATNATSPLFQAFGKPVAQLLYNAANDADRQNATAALDRLLDAVWDTYATDWTGDTVPVAPSSEIRLAVDCAVHDIDPNLVLEIRAGEGKWANPLGTGLNFRVSAIAAMLSADLTPAEVFQIAGDSPAFMAGLTPNHARTIKRFIRTGWTYRDVRQWRETTRDFDSAIPSAGWAALPPDLALLCVRAGLDAREARRMHSNGTLDRASLDALAALHQQHHN